MGSHKEVIRGSCRGCGKKFAADRTLADTSDRVVNGAIYRAYNIVPVFRCSCGEKYDVWLGEVLDITEDSPFAFEEQPSPVEKPRGSTVKHQPKLTRQERQEIELKIRDLEKMIRDGYADYGTFSELERCKELLK